VLRGRGRSLGHTLLSQRHGCVARRTLGACLAPQASQPRKVPGAQAGSLCSLGPLQRVAPSACASSVPHCDAARRTREHKRGRRARWPARPQAGCWRRAAAPPPAPEPRCAGPESGAGAGWLLSARHGVRACWRRGSGLRTRAGRARWRAAQGPNPTPCEPCS